MVTANNIRALICKSTDTKPVDKTDGYYLVNGDILYEMDTQTFYMYDAENKEWIEQ